MDAEQLTGALKSEAAALGFHLAGACPAVTPSGLHHFFDWLAADYGGEMEYLGNRREAYGHPQSILTDVRGILMLGLDYSPTLAPLTASGFGRVARYAQGMLDYHLVIRDRLNALGKKLVSWVPQVSWRGVVDTAPLLEREFAQLAGLGWQAKNTMLINPRRGSWFFLAALLVSCELVPDEPMTADHCGTCRACLDACPTEAFVAPRVLDARRCISYLTIEHRSAIPVALRTQIGDWVFGCDVCQEVCPWNRFAAETSEAAFQRNSALAPLELAPLFDLTEDEFRRRFRHTPLWRPKRRGLLRNAAIVLGNQRDAAALPALCKGLNDDEPLVRGAAAWALGQFDDARAQCALEARHAIEADASVLHEITAALARPPRENGSER